MKQGQVKHDQFKVLLHVVTVEQIYTLDWACLTCPCLIHEGSANSHRAHNYMSRNSSKNSNSNDLAVATAMLTDRQWEDKQRTCDHRAAPSLLAPEACDGIVTSTSRIGQVKSASSDQ